MRTSSQSNPSSKSFSISLSHLILCYLLLLSLFSFSAVNSQDDSEVEVDPDITANPSHHPSAIKLSRRGLENAQRAGLAANSLIRPTSIRDLDLSHLALVSTVQGSLVAIDRNDGKVLWNLDPTTQHDNNGNGFEPLVGSSYGERAQHSSFANLIKAASLDQSNGGKDSEALKELRQSGLYLIEPSSQGEIYVLTTDEESASDDDDGEAGTPRIEKLPLDIPQLVELSPFSFPGDPSRVFVGRKKAKLVEIDLKSGKIGAVFGGEEGVWCGSPSEGGCSDDSEQGNDGSEEPDWAYVGRTDYTVTIHVRSRPHLTQTLRFSTYTPNAADRDVAGIWARAGNHIDGKALLSAPEQGSILCLDTSQASDKQSNRDREKTLWSTQLNGTVAGIFDVVRPSSNLFSSTVREQAGIHSNSKSTRPVIVPHPPLSRQALLSYSESRSSLNENDSESETEKEVSEYKPQTYLGIADGHLFVMGSAKFPMVTFASPALAGIEADPSGFSRDEGRRIEGRHQHSSKKCHSYGCWIGSYPAQHDPEDQFSEDYHSGQPQLGIEDGGNRPGLDGGSDREQSNDSDPNSRIPFDQAAESEKKSQSSSRWKLTKSTPVVIFLQLIGILIVLIIGCAIFLGLEEQKRSAEVIGNSIANQVVWVPAIKEDEAGFSNSSSSSDPNSIPDSNSSSSSKSHFLSNNQDPLVVSQSRTTSPWAIPNISYSNVNGSSNTLHRRHQRKPSNPYTNTNKISTKPQVPPEPRIDPEEAAAAAEAARAKLLAEEEAREKAEKAAAKKRESKRRRRGKRAGAAVQAKAGKENSNLNGEGDEEYDEEEGGGNENQSNQAQVDKVKDGVLRKEDREGLGGNHEGNSSLFSNSESINRGLDAEIQGPEKASLSIIPPTPTTAALIDRGWLDPGSANPTNQGPPQDGLSRRNSANPEVDPASLPRKGSSLKLSSEVLGYGSSGTVVFKGTFQGRAVAVKRLLRDFVNVASKEVSLLESADNHPNVIRYFCKELTGSFLFIALELCPASLADVIEKPIEFRELGNKLDPKKALSQITSGLQHLHRLSIVHRDIKPQNILVSFSTGGNLKMLLSDFGLSKRLDSLAQTSFSQTMANPGGTVGWRAPEILRGDVSLDLGEDSESSGVSSENANSNGTETEKGEERRRLTRAVDVFALGCLAYYVLSNGEHPFGSRYEREMNIIRRQIDLSRLDGLGEEGHEAQHLISAMVSPDPRQRPSATDVLSHPYFWDSNRRLTFLQDASDRFECMDRDPPHPALVALENDYHLVVGPDWFKKVDKVFIEDLGKFRGYDGKSVQDLLRALRNKKHHYQDMAPLLKKVMGSLPDGFLSYFTRRFPLLFLRVYTVISEQPLIRTETQFIPYFTTSEPDH